MYVFKDTCHLSDFLVC